MLLPAAAVAGPLFVTATSAEVLIVTVDVALLLPGFGSVIEDDAVAVFESVEPLVRFAPALNTSVNVAEAPEARVAMLQLTAGVQLNNGPDVCASETNVVPAGSASLRVTLCASLGPLFVMVTL